MYLIVTAAWLAAFAGNIMAHPNGGMTPEMAGLGGPPPLSVTMAPPGQAPDAKPAANDAEPAATDEGLIDDDRPAVQANDADKIDGAEPSPAAFTQASSHMPR